MDISPCDPAAVTRRQLLRAGLVVPAVPALAALPATAATAQAAPGVAPAAQPRRPFVHFVPLDGETLTATGDPATSATSGRAGRSYVTGQLATARFRIAAFTWDGGPSRATMWIRTREHPSGRWSEWSALYDDNHGPEPGTFEAAAARPGTDPIVTTESDAIEVRVTTLDGTVPNDLRVDLIDPGPAATTAVAATPRAMTADVLQPAILTREDWGADETIRVGVPSYGDIRGGFVHHTAGTNTYTAGEVPAIIRGIYRFHVESRGWADIGYNFLIDKFGRIWEGRSGGVTEPVIGAHTLGYNTYAFAAAVLGTYVDRHPEAAVLQAFRRVIAWKFALHDVDPLASVAYPEQSTLPAIAGHRDGYPTECPGALLYARLGTIRTGVRDLLATAPTGSALTLTRHTSATRSGNRVYFDVSWRAGSAGVDGTVQLQVASGTGWSAVREVTVTGGAGTTFAAPTSDRTFRVRSVRSTSPAGLAPVTSPERTVRAVASRTTLTMARSGAVLPDGRIPIEIRWYAGSTGVTGRVSVQAYRSGGWRHIKDATVSRGAGSTTLFPGRTEIYRLRGSTAASPSTVDLSHPASTSNEYRAVAS